MVLSHGGVAGLLQVLHANWSEDGLHLWCEPMGEGAPAALEALVRDAGLPKPGRAVASTLELKLPASNGSALPSDEIADLSERSDDGAALIRSFVIPTLRLDPADAFRFLLRVGAGQDDVAATRGPGLTYLAAVAALVGDLLAEQRFIPSMRQMEGGVLEARWLPWLGDPEASRRAAALLAGTPPAARATVNSFDHQPWNLLNHALCAMTDAVVRDVLIAESFQDSLEGRDATTDPSVAFLEGLLGPGPRVTAANGSAAESFRDVRDWLRRLADSDVEARYRLCVRIHEPVGPAPDGAAASSPVWRLTLHLEPRRDDGPSIDVSSMLGGDAAPHALDDEAHEFALRELARLQPIYEPLGEILEEGSNHGIELSTAQAYEFLRDVAPVLSESGVHVIMPAWWGQPAGRLGMRLVLEEDRVGSESAESSSGEGGRTRFGLQTLVQYQWQLAVGDRALTLEEFKRIASQAAPLMKVDGRWMEVRTEDLDAARELLEKGAVGVMTMAEALQAAYSGPSHALPVLGVASTGWIQDLLEGRFAGASLEFVSQPHGFVGNLRPYQKAGLSWLAFLDAHGLGACLADDMGLGKTIQLIALLLHEREHLDGHGKPRPTLIVAPMSVVGNWVREIGRFGPTLQVHVHHGLDRKLGDAFAAAASHSDVVVTTYGLVNRDVESLRTVKWGRVVLDEAQYVKNTPTKQAQAIRMLDSDRRIALTGTPVENRLSELWSIMDFCNPGYLGTAGDFRRRFANAVERHRDRHRAEALRSLIRPFVLRRLKTDPEVVPDLPELVETKQSAPLTAEQARLYEDVVASMLRQVDNSQGMQRRGLVLAGIVRLKQICNHPANLSDDAPVAGLDPALHGDVVTLAARSGKVRRLLELLGEVVAAGDQALIFTQYRRMGHLLTRIIQHELNAPVLFMHGGTSRGKRQEMVDQFQSGRPHIPVFILSLRAGGVGLNLTAASHVFHFDRWWNPAVENQATDRAFRIGQKRNVHVHKLVCTGTLEERIDEMLEEKTDLADRIVGSGDAWLTELSTGQLRDLLMLRAGAVEVES